MKRDSLFVRPLRAAVVAGILVGYSGLPGCSSGEYEVAPKLKGSKDEIQKALQSGGAKPGGKVKGRRKD
jgi:hypothetical protein